MVWMCSVPEGSWIHETFVWPYSPIGQSAQAVLGPPFVVSHEFLSCSNDG